MTHARMLIYIDRLCRITFRNVKVRDEKINRCDRHALIDHSCAYSASAINTVACVESIKHSIILY